MDPTSAVVATGDWVTCGATPVTVRLAAVVVAEPSELVNTARNSSPESARAAVPVSVVAVAPEMFVNVEPPSVDTCHCTVGFGVPEPAAVNEYGCAAGTVVSCGCWVTCGTDFGTTTFDAADGALVPTTFRVVTLHV